MSNFLPPSPFGFKGNSPFYLCDCPKCGFRQSYELGDPGEVIVTGATGPDDILTVATIPSTCPKCGAKWKKTQMPDARQY